MMKKLLIPFQNVKFNVWLFAALALASVLGTLIPQKPESPDKVQEFLRHSPQWGAILDKLGFFDVYYSWWFIGLLGLMAFNVVVCKLIFGKFPGLRAFKPQERGPESVASQPFRSQWSSPQPVPDAKGGIEAAFKRRGYRARARALPDGSILLLAVRHRWQMYGSWISHVSILVILLANLTGSLWGFREVLNIPEGDSARMEKRPWVVACDDFTVDWYPETDTPRTFASSLRLFEKGRLAQESRILVNEPLQHKNVRFYQATYGPYLKGARIGFFLRGDPKRSPVVQLKLDEEAPVPGTPYSLRILEFVPDFSMNENREISSRSPRPSNPALQVLVLKNGKPVKAPWILEQYPTLQMPPLKETDEFILVLAEYMPGYYTGLQVTYDPGADLFWIGCTLLVLGLATLFYLHQRKVWVLLQPGPAGCALQVGGASSRGASFESEFQELARELRAASSA